MLRTLLISELFPPRIGGTSRWFYEIYRRFPSECASILTDYQAGDERNDIAPSLHVIRTPMRINDWGFLSPSSFMQYMRCTRFVRSLMRSHHFERIDCARVMPEGVIAYLIGKMSGIPYIVYAHGEEIGTALSSRQLCFLMRLVYGSAHKIIANSRNTKILLNQVGVPDAKVIVVSPGVDTSRFSPGERELSRKRLNLEGHTVLLSVGRLQRRKGHDQMIRAIPGLAAKIPNFKYVIVGNGEEEQRLRHLANENGCSSIVEFAGGASDDLLPDYYRSCDVFVLPNREESNHDVEGFGIVFLEASSCARPVVGGRSGGTSDAIEEGETGLLVNGESVEEITAAVLSLLVDPEKANEMGQKGRMRTIERFGWEKGVEKIMTLN